jgi:hypothetical protein
MSKTYGPYKNSEGRYFIIIIFDNGKRRTVSYPKYIMEQYLGRELDPDKETIDHIDGDFTNNNLSNLRIINRSDHAKNDVKRVKLGNYICPQCNKQFKAKCKDVDHNRKNGKAGPFCSRSCAGKYSANIQWHNGKIYKPFPLKPKRRYYTNKKLMNI